MVFKAYLIYLLLFRIAPISSERFLFHSPNDGDVFLLQERFLSYRDVEHACRQLKLKSWNISSDDDLIRAKRALEHNKFEKIEVWVKSPFEWKRLKRFQKGTKSKHYGSFGCFSGTGCPVLTRDCLKTYSYKYEHVLAKHDCASTAACFCVREPKPPTSRTLTTTTRPKTSMSNPTTSDLLTTDDKSLTLGTTPETITSTVTETTTLTTTETKTKATPEAHIQTTSYTASDVTTEAIHRKASREPSTKDRDELPSTSLVTYSTSPIAPITAKATTKTAAASTTTTTVTTAATAAITATAALRTIATKTPTVLPCASNESKSKNDDDYSDGDNLCPCPRIMRTNITMIELGQIIEKERKILAVDITILSSTRRRLESAKDDRVSSFLMSLVAMVVMGFLYVLILLNDLITVGYKAYRRLHTCWSAH